MKSNKISKKMDFFQIILYIVVSVYVLSMIYLLSFGLINSLKYWIDFNTGNVFGLPRPEFGWRFENYKKTFELFYVQIKPIGEAPRNVYTIEMLWNSLSYSVCMAFFCIMTQVMTAYAVAKYDFKFRNLIYTVAIIVMLIPIVGSLASEVQISNMLGLRNNLLGICIMRCKYPGIYFLVFYATFKSVSWTYAEAAQIDGAGHLQIFLRIMLPMIKNSLFAVFILTFITNWNEYYTPMIFLPDRPTIAYGLFMYQNNTETAMSTPIKLSAGFLTCIPIIVIFILFRNKIMGNVNVGGIKG